MVIPIAPILCASFKRCVILDNRDLNYKRFVLDEFDYVIGINYLQQEIIGNLISFMSVENRIDVINTEVQNRHYDSYLEIFSEQYPIYDVYTPHKIRIFAYYIDYFFATNTEKFDVILIDGIHQSDHVETDIRNALKFLNPNGIIIVHNCNPYSKEMQQYDQMSGEWTGDGWKAFVKYRFKSEYLTYTYAFDYGVGVIDTSKQSNIPDDDLKKTVNEMSYSDMTYEWFTGIRDALLNLKYQY